MCLSAFLNRDVSLNWSSRNYDTSRWKNSVHTEPCEEAMLIASNSVWAILQQFFLVLLWLGWHSLCSVSPGFPLSRDCFMVSKSDSCIDLSWMIADRFQGTLIKYSVLDVLACRRCFCFVFISDISHKCFEKEQRNQNAKLNSDVRSSPLQIYSL